MCERKRGGDADGDRFCRTRTKEEKKPTLSLSFFLFLSLSLSQLAHGRRRRQLPDIQLGLEHVLVEGVPRRRGERGRRRGRRRARAGSERACSESAASVVVVVVRALAAARGRGRSKGAPASPAQDRPVVGHGGGGVDHAPQDRAVRQGAERPRVPGRRQRQGLVVGEDPAVALWHRERRRRRSRGRGAALFALGRGRRTRRRCGCGDQEMLPFGGGDAADEDLLSRFFCFFCF